MDNDTFLHYARAGQVEENVNDSESFFIGDASNAFMEERSSAASIPPTVSFSLAAIVRKRPDSQTPTPSQYVLVHEKPPRGWWLPGGGVEYHDSTPVYAAVRETLEEAGANQFQAALAEQDHELLPKMTHLLAVQQSPGRIRFIFRGEWLDELSTDVLKLPPGDKESIEAKWVTLDQVKSLLVKERYRNAQHVSSVEWGDPWLRGHEPVTFFSMLERSMLFENQRIPGLPICSDNDIAIGAFFKRLGQEPEKISKPPKSRSGRNEIVTHLKAKLLVFEEGGQRIIVDSATRRFPLYCVNNQHEQTLRQLVDEIIESLPSANTHKTIRKGTLRVEYVIHENGTEATLTVFPYVIFSSADAVRFTSDMPKQWISVDDLGDSLEKLLGKALMDDDIKLGNIDVLDDRE